MKRLDENEIYVVLRALDIAKNELKNTYHTNYLEEKMLSIKTKLAQQLGDFE